MKSYQLALIAAATAICGCDPGAGDSSPGPCSDMPDCICTSSDSPPDCPDQRSKPTRVLIAENDHGKIQVYTELGLSQCTNTEPPLQVQEGVLQLGPPSVQTPLDTDKGFFLAWSVCNPTNAPTPSTRYDLLDIITNNGIDVFTASPHTFSVPDSSDGPSATALLPCRCDPQIVLINVPAGGESAIGLVTSTLPMVRIDVGAGDHKFTLSAPFNSETIAVNVHVQ